MLCELFEMKFHKKLDAKKSSKCETISSKSNSYKDKTTKDGLNPICKDCRGTYYSKVYDQINKYRCKYKNRNRAEINIYGKIKRNIGFNFKLIHNMKVRSRQAVESQNVKKINKSFDSFGCSQSFLKRWFFHQLYGSMIEENYGSVWTIDPCHPLQKSTCLMKMR